MQRGETACMKTVSRLAYLRTSCRGMQTEIAMSLHIHTHTYTYIYVCAFYYQEVKKLIHVSGI
jgi:hypothetical protein